MKSKQSQFLVGCLVIFLAYKLFSLGVFDQWLGGTDDDQVESVNVVALAVSALVQAVTLVGYIAIGLCTGLGPLAESFTDKVTGIFSLKPSSPAVDTVALNQVLSDFSERLNEIERSVKLATEKASDESN